MRASTRGRPADVGLAERQRLAGRHAQLQLDEVEPRDRLGHRVLDLQTDVHLEGKNRDGSSAAVMNSTVPAFV